MMSTGMEGVTHLGIVTGGAALLSTVVFDARNEKSERDSWRAAERLLWRWQSVRHEERLAIVPLTRRSWNGWEAARNG
jgi:hypothetical protein